MLKPGASSLETTASISITPSTTTPPPTTQPIKGIIYIKFLNYDLIYIPMHCLIAYPFSNSPIPDDIVKTFVVESRRCVHV